MAAVCPVRWPLGVDFRFDSNRNKNMTRDISVEKARGKSQLKYCTISIHFTLTLPPPMLTLHNVVVPSPSRHFRTQDAGHRRNDTGRKTQDYGFSAVHHGD